jgi:hypothetical protein
MMIEDTLDSDTQTKPIKVKTEMLKVSEPVKAEDPDQKSEKKNKRNKGARQKSKED